MADFNSTQANAEWVTMHEAAKRMAYNNALSLAHWCRQFENKHPDVQIRRVTGRIFWPDLLHAFEVSASDRANRRTGRKGIVAHAEA